jgi:UPF0271 protein
MTLINCDLGECLSPNPDQQIMPLIDQASIACGGHAGDSESMARAVQLAKQYQVQIGAHPSYPDKVNYGRIRQHYEAKALFEHLYRQVEQLNDICLKQDAVMSYIKPHGALYHAMMGDPTTLAVIGQVLDAFPQSLSLIVEAGTDTGHLRDFALCRPPTLIYEAFADRAYHHNKIVPRSEQGAMLRDAAEIIEQYQQFSTASALKVDTVCFHSDHPPSVDALKRIKARR